MAGVGCPHIPVLLRSAQNVPGGPVALGRCGGAGPGKGEGEVGRDVKLGHSWTLPLLGVHRGPGWRRTGADS